MKKVSRFLLAALAVSIAAAFALGAGIDQEIQSVINLDPGLKDTLDVIDTRSCTELGIYTVQATLSCGRDNESFRWVYLSEDEDPVLQSGHAEFGRRHIQAHMRQEVITRDRPANRARRMQ